MCMNPPSLKFQEHSYLSHVLKKPGIKKRPLEQRGTRDNEMCVSARLSQRSLNTCAKWKGITGWLHLWLAMGKGGPFSSQSSREMCSFRRVRKYRSLLQKYKSCFNKWLKLWELVKKVIFPDPQIRKSFPAQWNAAITFTFLLYSISCVYSKLPVLGRMSKESYLAQRCLQKVKINTKTCTRNSWKPGQLQISQWHHDHKGSKG